MGVPGSGGTATTGEDGRSSARVIRRAARGGTDSDTGLTPEAIRQLVRKELQRAGATAPAQAPAPRGAASGTRGAAGPLAGIRRLVRRELRRLEAGSQAGESVGSESGAGGGGSAAPGASGAPARTVRAIIRQEMQGLGTTPTGAGADGSAGSGSTASLTAELAANLQELRRVIQQSQQLARKIEEALRQEPSGSGGTA